MLNNFSKIKMLFTLLSISIVPLTAQLSPEEAVRKMGRGINMGNTLDAPKYEGEWAPEAKDFYFQAYEDAGFTSLRVPITWDNRTAKTPPYKVDTKFMDRVEHLIDLALETEMIIIMNMHHEKWLKNDYNEANQERFKSIWTQIVDRFQNKSERLLFEPLNEPGKLTIEQADKLNAEALKIIREVNPTRIVIMAGTEWSALKDLKNASYPEDDYLIAGYHSYDPWSFAGEYKGRWGNEEEVKNVKDNIKSAAQWSKEQGIPVILSEFGCRVEANYNSRMLHYATYVEAAVENGLAFQVWDDYGWFKVFNRDEKSWDEVRDILIHYSNEAPNNLKYEFSKDDTGTIKFSWNNRSTKGGDIIVQQKEGDKFVNIDTVAAGVNQYDIKSLTEGKSNIFRVAQGSGKNLKVSYPREINPTKPQKHL